MTVGKIIATIVIGNTKTKIDKSAIAQAVAIAETVLDGEGLNDVQELIFKQCWSGRCSYEEIAKITSRSRKS